MLEERALRSSRQNNRLRAEAQELFHDVTANKSSTPCNGYDPIEKKRPSVGVEVRGRALALIGDTCRQDLAPQDRPSSSAEPIRKSPPWASNRVFHGPWSHHPLGGRLP